MSAPPQGSRRCGAPDATRRPGTLHEAFNPSLHSRDRLAMLRPPRFVAGQRGDTACGIGRRRRRAMKRLVALPAVVIASVLLFAASAAADTADTLVSNGSPTTPFSQNKQN